MSALPTPPGSRPPLKPPPRTCSLACNHLGPDGARALAPAFENLVELEKLECAANLAPLPILAQTIHRRARSLSFNGLGPDGARALAPALEELVWLEELKCVANATQQPTPAQTSPHPPRSPTPARTSCVSSDPLYRSIELENDLGDGLAAIQAALPEGCEVQ